MSQSGIVIDAETGEIVEASDPWQRHQRIVGLRTNIQRNFLELGGELYEFRQAEQWKKVGYATFNAYLASPEVDLGRRTAFALIAVYHCFSLTLCAKVQPAALSEAGWTKLEMIRPYMIDRNVTEWVDRARTLSRSDLAKAIKEELKPPPPPLPLGKYRVIYADPPWKYGDILPPGYGAATHHYQTMTNGELCALDIKELVGPDAVLFLWATSPMLERAFEVMKAWGFNYKTSFVWDKVEHNFGFYNSVRHELLLIGGRGHSRPDDVELHDSVVSLPRSQIHSQKPEYFRELIDQMYASGSRLELFGRGKPPEGWTSWGHEAGE